MLWATKLLWNWIRLFHQNYAFLAGEAYTLKQHTTGGFMHKFARLFPILFKLMDLQSVQCFGMPSNPPAWCVPQSMWTSHNNKIFVWSLQTIRSVQCRQENEVDTLLSLLNKQCLLRTQSSLLQRLACIHCTKLLRGVGWGWEEGETLWVCENTSALTVVTYWMTYIFSWKPSEDFVLRR